MNKVRITLVSLVLCAFLAGCGQAPAMAGGKSSASPAGKTSEGESSEKRAVSVCRIVDGAETGELLLAELDGTQSGVYLLTAGNLPVTVDGKPADAMALTDGMTLEVEHGGTVLESYPARFGKVFNLRAQTPLCGYTDLCGLWLKVMDDLWNKDLGLNEAEDGGTVPYVGVDLSRAPGGLTAAEQSAVAWQFGHLHGAQALAGSYEELAEQGYFDREQLYWADGVLFSITAREGDETAKYKLPTLTFDAQKWRGGDGAYFFSNCVCVWPESGAWTEYRIGGEAIS